MKDFFLQGNMDYLIFFDGIRVDHLIKSWTSNINIYSGYGSSSFDIVYFKELFDALDDWVDVNIFVKNMFTQKYESVFEGNIRNLSRQTSRQSKSFSVGATDKMIWFNKIPVPVYYSIEDVLDVNQKFLWAAQGIDYEAVSGFATLSSIQFADMNIESMIQQIFSMIREAYKSYSETDSVLGWANIESKIRVMSDIDEKLRQSKILEYIIRSKSSVVSTIYVLLNDILSQLTFEYYQDKDGMVRIKQPFWGEDFLRNHVIDPMMIRNLSEFMDWDKRISRVITHGGADAWLDENAETTSVVIPMGAYVDGKMFEKGIDTNIDVISGVSSNAVAPSQDYTIATEVASIAQNFEIDANILYKAIEIKTGFNFTSQSSMYSGAPVLTPIVETKNFINTSLDTFLNEFVDAAKTSSVCLFHLYAIGISASNLKQEVEKLPSGGFIRDYASRLSVKEIYKTSTGHKGILGIEPDLEGTNVRTYKGKQYDLTSVAENILCGANIFRDYIISYSGNFGLSALAYAWTKEVVDQAMFIYGKDNNINIVYANFFWECLLEEIPGTSMSYIERAYQDIYSDILKKRRLFLQSSENNEFARQAVISYSALCKTYIGITPTFNQAFTLDECLNGAKANIASQSVPNNRASQLTGPANDFKNIWDNHSGAYDTGILYAMYTLGEDVVLNALKKTGKQRITWEEVKGVIISSVKSGNFLGYSSSGQTPNKIPETMLNIVDSIDAALESLKKTYMQHQYTGSSFQSAKEWKNVSSMAPDLILYLNEGVRTLGGSNQQGKFGALRMRLDDNGNITPYHHKGMDITLNDGMAPLYSIGDATITQASEQGNYGKTIVYKLTGTNISVRYAHMSEIHVHKGQHVKHNEKVGLQGSTGDSTAPHLHIEVTVDDAYYDPALFIAQYIPNFLAQGSNYKGISHKLSPDTLKKNLREFSIVCRWDRTNRTPSLTGKTFPEYEFGKSIAGSVSNPDWAKQSVDSIVSVDIQVPTISTVLDISNDEKKHGINTYIVNQPLVKNLKTDNSGIYDYDISSATDMLAKYSKYMYNMLNSRVHTSNLVTLPMPWIRPGFNVLVDPCTVNKVFYTTGISFSGNPSSINQTLSLSFGRDPSNYANYTGNAFVSSKKYGSEVFGKTLNYSELEQLISEIRTYHNSKSNKEMFAHMNKHYSDLYGEMSYSGSNIELCGVLGWGGYTITWLENYFNNRYSFAPDTIKRRRGKLLNAMQTISASAYKEKLSTFLREGHE
jgi:murein DD-endopeptidase MepM/ murein hydrolase activator NlpD